MKKFLKKIGGAIFSPSARGKIRWKIFSIIILTSISVVVVYPQGYNQLVKEFNKGLEQVGWKIETIQENDFNLGLDLQGGAHLVYQADLKDVNDKNEAMEILRDRIERRINSLGVTEPLVQKAGSDRLVVELAGVNVETAIDRIGETPLLEFREANDQPQRELTEEEKNEIDQFNTSQKQKAEDALTRLQTGTESFEDVAREVSESPQAKENGGDLGTVTRQTNPQLIQAAEDTRIGHLVGRVIETDNGYYVLRVDDRNTDQTEMNLSHIIICYKGALECTAERTREEALEAIKNIRAEITPENFAEKAPELTDDSLVDLGWVIPGVQIIKDYEQTVEDLPIGTISEPVESRFGFHILYKIDERPLERLTLHGIYFNKMVADDVIPTPELFINTGLSGANVVNAQLYFDPQTGAPQVSIQFDDEGTRMFSDLTQKYLHQIIAIYLDNEPISTPTVQNQIANGQAVITGLDSVEEAKELARRLKDGALPVSINLVQQQTVGATLGHESLQKSLYAGIIGLILVGVFMLIYYRLLGLVAILALSIYGTISLMALKVIGVTLTLSGIAGFVLSIGMAVDANVLVFERFREERRLGKSLRESIEEAFRRAWPSIWDGNVSTLITCAILFWFGTSLVRGFALTLAIGVTVSMFTAYLITRTILRLILGWKFLHRPSLYGRK